jgi:hypothetical protein
MSGVLLRSGRFWIVWGEVGERRRRARPRRCEARWAARCATTFGVDCVRISHFRDIMEGERFAPARYL